MKKPAERKEFEDTILNDDQMEIEVAKHKFPKKCGSTPAIFYRDDPPSVTDSRKKRSHSFLDLQQSVVTKLEGTGQYVTI